jgi:hypothetical protein
LAFAAAEDDRVRWTRQVPDQTIWPPSASDNAPEQTTHAERIAPLRDDIGVRQRRPRGFSDAALHSAVDLRGALDFGDRADELHPTNAGYAKVAERFRRTLREAGVG